MGRSRSRHHQSSAGFGRLGRPAASGSPMSRGPGAQTTLGPVGESIAGSEAVSTKIEPPRVTSHRRSRSWVYSMTSRKDKDDLRMPEEYHGTTNGSAGKRGVDPANDGRSSRTRGWLWPRPKDTAEQAPTDASVIELLDSADEDVPSGSGVPSPRDNKSKWGLFSWRRSSKAGEQRQAEGRAAVDGVSAAVGADDVPSGDARSNDKASAMAELDSTDAASTTQSADSSTPDARTLHDGAGMDSSRPNSRQSAYGKDDDCVRKPSKHRRGGSFFERMPWSGKAAPEGAADAAQDASLLSKSRSRRGEAAVKKGDVSGTLHHKSALSCFGLPQVADDDDGSLGDAGPPLIEWVQGLTEGSIGMRNLCNTCFINATLQCLRATPGLLQHLAPELLEDPSQLPKDLIERLSAGPPVVQLAGDDPAAAPTSSFIPPAGQVYVDPAHADVSQDAVPAAPGSPSPAPAQSDAAAEASAPPDGAVAEDVRMPAVQTPADESMPGNGHASLEQDVPVLAHEASCSPAPIAVQQDEDNRGGPRLPLVEQVATAGDAAGAGRGSGERCVDAPATAGGVGAALPIAEQPDVEKAQTGGRATSGVAEDAASDGHAASADGEDIGAVGLEAAGADAAPDADQAGTVDHNKIAAAEVDVDGRDGQHVSAVAAAEAARKEDIARDLLQVMAQLAVSSGDDPVAPRQLYRDMANNEMWAQFSNGGQHDAHELLRFVMSVLHEVHDRITEKPPYVELEDVPEEAPADKADRLWSLLHDREASALSDLFQGQLESRLTCSKCSSTFYTYEPFMDLSLSLFKEGKTYWPNKKTIDRLEDCFRAFTDEEKLDEPYFCPTCNARHSATKALRIHRFPHCLVLHIKRFKSTNRTHLKLSSNVSFPLNGLNLAPFSTAAPGGKGAATAPIRTGKDAPGLYDLYAVSNHTGSLDSGHYTAYVKVADPENEGEQKWLLLADDKAQAESIVSAEAYMLFYVQRAQKQTTPQSE